MPIYPENFVANSLSGTILVTNGFANVTLPTNPFALEGDKNFVIRLRKGGVNGLVIATSPTITVRDTSQLVSLTSNVSTVAEGNLVTFTLVTANAADGSNVFYSIFPVTSNVTTADFVGANVGRATIINNQATFTIFANADVSLVNETGETFRVQLRENSTTGNIIFNTSNVVITDVSKRINVFEFVESARSIAEGSSVTFTISAHNIATGTLLYYYTSGNADITGANTGSVAMNSVSNTITITTASTIPANQSRVFNLVLSETNLGSPIATSNAITVVDSALAYLNATGGTVTSIDGFRIHTFTTSSNLVINNAPLAVLKNANLLIVAGGGAGGQDNNYGGGGGGAGGLIQQFGIELTSNLSIVIGAGGSSSGVNGSNTTLIGGSLNYIAVGGGFGGGFPPVANGSPGGSGGGARANQPFYGPTVRQSGFGFPSPTQQGFPGGINIGGGGGAGAAGGDNQGSGGNGVTSTITGASVIYAGGGGSVDRSGGTGGGGGGAPNSPPSVPGTPGTINTGGGGGSGNVPSASAGGSGGSGIVVIRYPWRPAAFFTSVTPNVGGVYEGANAFFVVNTTFANATTLFYDTVGNVTSSNFVGGNTGSFIITSNATVLRLETVANIPLNESRVFALRIREDSATGNIALISSNVGIFDANLSIYINATGGNVFTLDGYRTHIFTASNNFVVNGAGLLGGNIEYMIVAGGGGGQTGGQNDGGGGGGAGGLLSGTSTVVANTYVVTVGSGGGTATSGSNSSVLSLIAVGGGAGGATNLNTTGPIGNGGSGGGSSFNNFGTAPGEFYGGGAGIAGQGNPGGRTPYRSPSYGWGGGGGGAGGAGGGNLSPSQSTAVVGGVGISSPLSPSIPGFFGTPGPAPGRWFAGGGGTGGANFPSNSNSPFGAAGGAGGGGKGGDGQGPGGPGQVGMSGNVNTGGGGGAGGGANPTIGTGGSGGSGIVIIRYPYA